jgi:hypothetical protein
MLLGTCTDRLDREGINLSETTIALYIAPSRTLYGAVAMQLT